MRRTGMNRSSFVIDHLVSLFPSFNVRFVRFYSILASKKKKKNVKFIHASIAVERYCNVENCSRFSVLGSQVSPISLLELMAGVVTDCELTDDEKQMNLRRSLQRLFVPVEVFESKKESRANRRTLRLPMR